MPCVLPQSVSWLVRLLVSSVVVVISVASDKAKLPGRGKEVSFSFELADRALPSLFVPSFASFVLLGFASFVFSLLV